MIIIALGGPAGAGKDEIAAALIKHHGFRREALADPMRKMFEIATGIPVEAQAVLKADPEAAPRYRRTMQTLGTECFRDGWSKSVWIDNLARRIRAAHEQGVPGVVITDARFMNELEALHQLGATLVHLDTNDSWKRCPPPKSKIVRWLGERWPAFVYRWTQNPYYHPSEAETREAYKLGVFQIERWNGGALEVIARRNGVDVHGRRRIYDSTPEQLANSIRNDAIHNNRVISKIRRE